MRISLILILLGLALFIPVSSQTTPVSAPPVASPAAVPDTIPATIPAPAPTAAPATATEEAKPKAADDIHKQFKLPTIVFKGKKINRAALGTFDRILVDGVETTADPIVFPRSGDIPVEIIAGNKHYKGMVYSINGWLTIIPPLLAIALALIFKDVVVALFVGIFSGSLMLSHFDFVGAFFAVLDHYILDAVIEKEHASIIMFTMLLGGMVGIITKSGGFKGIVDKLSKKVNSAGTTEFYTWLMGVFIFFDDYTNTLIVGNTMRPLSDRWKISREKLAYIVDSTAAPMASLAVISTWIGFEISLINQQLVNYNVEADAFHLFLSSLPYRFYPLLGLIFVFLTFALKRDFGPMLKAENRARRGQLMKDKAVPLSDFESSGLSPDENTKSRWYNGIIPIVMVIVATFTGLYTSGMASLAAGGNAISQKSIFEMIFSVTVFKDLGTIVSSADSFKVLLWASMLGVFSAIILALVQRILKLRELIESFVLGMKSMLMAIVILALAWSLGVVLTELHTADFLVSLLQEWNMDYHLFPAIVFVLSSFIAFSTGTSWGTISIMYPLILPIIIVMTRGTPSFEHFMVLSISSVLAGAVFGDHCSPISDTTIMSSMASSCDHIDHVKTQLPYATLIAFIALFIGIIPVSYGFPYLISLVASIGVCIAVLMFIGKKPIEM